MSHSRHAAEPPKSALPFLEAGPKGVYLRVRLQPRASRNSVEGLQGNCLKIRLTAPPVEGEANRALIEFLSEALGVRKSALSIDSGLKSREKRVRVEGAGVDDLEKKFRGLLR